MTLTPKDKRTKRGEKMEITMTLNMVVDKKFYLPAFIGFLEGYFSPGIKFYNGSYKVVKKKK